MTDLPVDSRTVPAAPPEAPETATPDAERSSPVASLRRWVNSSLPWLTSLTVNLTLLVILALLTEPGLFTSLRKPLEVAASFAPVAEFKPLDLQEAGEAGVTEVTVNFAASSDDAPEAANPSEIELSKDLLAKTTTQPFLGDVSAGLAKADAPPQRRAGLLGLPDSGELNTIVPSTTARGPVTERELRERESLEDIAWDIGDEIRAQLSGDNLLVVWLLDGSISLLDNRQELANHLDNVYASLDQEFAQAKGKTKRVLMNATVGYGAGVETISPPYRVAKRATIAMREMGVDATGKENICQAIMWTAARARDKWDERRGRVMIVVFTDESGDDLQYIEETIECCRYFKVNVSFIGPSGILGTFEGYHRWLHQQPGWGTQLFWLPVMKGPDEAVPERLRLPYWWSTEALHNRLNLPAGVNEFPREAHIAAEWQAKLPDWARGAEVNPGDYFCSSFSGRELLNLNSGFPPWGLMRIARETGGTYTMFDRRGDRGPFRLNLMRPYTPDYRSLFEIMDDMQRKPLRLAVINAAAMTQQFAPRVTPRISFLSSGFMTPEVFQNRCLKEMPHAEAQAARTAELIEQVLAAFGPNGMENQYELEEPRWQAWYDLNVGRLMLQSVRYAEYRMTLRLLLQPENFPRQANHIDLLPFATIRSGEKSLQRAMLGEKLLKRCLEKNPGTPWAFLAARELANPLSVDFNWRYFPPPPPARFVPSTPSQPRPQLVLPNL